MLKCLTAENLVSQDPQSRRYYLGPLVFELGITAGPRFNIRDLCADALDRVAAETGDTAFLIIRSGDDSLCVDRREGAFPIKTFTVDVGVRRPLGVGAGSLAILTALPEALAAAATGGPAVLLLPKDVQQERLRTALFCVVPPAPSPPPDLADVVGAVRGSRGPVTIIAGEQVARDDARAELAQLSAVLGAWVATVPDAKDVAASSIGVTGVMGHPSVVTAASQSALCLLVGTRLAMTGIIWRSLILVPARATAFHERHLNLREPILFSSNHSLVMSRGLSPSVKTLNRRLLRMSVSGRT
jgi:hypothetical protein